MKHAELTEYDLYLQLEDKYEDVDPEEEQDNKVIYLFPEPNINRNQKKPTTNILLK